MGFTWSNCSGHCLNLTVGLSVVFSDKLLCTWILVERLSKFDFLMQKSSGATGECKACDAVHFTC